MLGCVGDVELIGRVLDGDVGAAGRVLAGVFADLSAVVVYVVIFVYGFGGVVGGYWVFFVDYVDGL